MSDFQKQAEHAEEAMCSYVQKLREALGDRVEFFGDEIIVESKEDLELCVKLMGE